MGTWLVAAVALVVVSCAEIDTDTDPVDEFELSVIGDVEVDGHVVLSGGSTGACACQTQACRKRWIREHMGCDLCVVFMCPDGAVHTCVLCAPRATRHTRVARSQRR